MWPELLYIIFVLAGGSIAYAGVLPRLVVNPITQENTLHPVRPTLSGVRFAAWVALMAFLNLAFCWGYLALWKYRTDERIFFMCAAVSIVFLLFQPPAARIQQQIQRRDPDVRFGAFLGALLGIVSAFLLFARSSF